MGVYKAAKYYKELDADIIVSCHMDNPDFPIDLKQLKYNFEKDNVNYKILKYEEEHQV